MIRIFIFVMSMAHTFSLFAHPTSYKGSFALMTYSQTWLKDYWMTYSFRSDMALAARYMRMEMPEGRMETYLPQLDVLVKRWNEKDFQANIYGYAGAGLMRFASTNGSAILGAVETDVESRKYFALGKVEWMRPSDGPILRQYVLKLGIAPYEAEFNELASWFMIQYQFHSALLRKRALTPLIRLFYRNVLWETGMSLDGDLMVNLMFHF